VRLERFASERTALMTLERERAHRRRIGNFDSVTVADAITKAVMRNIDAKTCRARMRLTGFVARRPGDFRRELT
jgi:hypothetical protein